FLDLMRVQFLNLMRAQFLDRRRAHLLHRHLLLEDPLRSTFVPLRLTVVTRACGLVLLQQETLSLPTLSAEKEQEHSNESRSRDAADCDASFGTCDERSAVVARGRRGGVRGGDTGWGGGRGGCVVSGGGAGAGGFCDGCGGNR
ncbi:MAG: hypothetical protein Q9206_005945, partial [Seirophora lacunosa]